MINTELKERTESHVRIYFERTQDREIQAMMPQTVTILDQALENYRKTLQPNAASYGRTVYADGVYVGDIWCYCIDPAQKPNAMISYCLFDKSCWGKGIASAALAQFLSDIVPRFGLVSLGAFTYSTNAPSIRVLLKNGFSEVEEFVDAGVVSKYFQKQMEDPL